MSTTPQNKCALRKSSSDEGFHRPTLFNQSGNRTSTSKHKLSLQHDVMLLGNLSQNSNDDHVTTSQSDIASTDSMEPTDSQL